MLFRHRLQRQTPEQVSAFMRSAGLEYESVDDDTKQELLPQLRAVAIATRPFG